MYSEKTQSENRIALISGLRGWKTRLSMHWLGIWGRSQLAWKSAPFIMSQYIMLPRSQENHLLLLLHQYDQLVLLACVKCSYLAGVAYCTCFLKFSFFILMKPNFRNGAQRVANIVSGCFLHVQQWRKFCRVWVTPQPLQCRCFRTWILVVKRKGIVMDLSCKTLDCVPA